eukprot:7574500-Alexandrium_andersonii.AAC.1
MSASLVGSEMCIRDRLCSAPEFATLRSCASEGLRTQHPRANTQCPVLTRRELMALHSCLRGGAHAHRALTAGVRLAVAVHLRGSMRAHRALVAR